MMRPKSRLSYILPAMLLVATARTPAQAGVGVLTWREGHVTIDRAEKSLPPPPNAADLILPGDRITTAERSLTRLVLGDVAIVMIHELTVVTINDEIGKSALTLERGAIAESVARGQERPAHEIRTPNTILRGRGALAEIAVDIRPDAGSNVETTVCVHGGLMSAQAIGGAEVRIGAQECITITANVMGPIRPFERDDLRLRRVLSGMLRSAPPWPPSAQIDAARQACDGGNARACSDLGAIFERGAETRNNLSLASEYYLRGCDTGDPIGCRRLASMYERGEGWPKRPSQAAKYYGRGCDHGDAEACTRLAKIYETAVGVMADLRRAGDLYRRACELGALEACGPPGS